MINAKQIWPGAWQLLFLFYWPNKLLFQSGETIWTFVWGSGYRKGRPFGWSPVIPPLVPTCFPMCTNPPQQKSETTASRRHPACKQLGSAVIHDWAALPWSNETPEAKPPSQGLNATSRASATQGSSCSGVVRAGGIAAGGTKETVSNPHAGSRDAARKKRPR